MVNNRELSSSAVIDENQLENFLEENNPAYKLAREQYNTLIKQTLNPLINNGLTGDRTGFIIILLEKILKNTEVLFEENKILKNQTNTIEQNILQLKNEGLDPIKQAGNNITSALNRFEEGFNYWNTKFDTWNIGFKDFEENLSGTNRFLQDFADYWNNKTDLIQINLNKIENHIIQWNEEVIRINNTIQSLEKRFHQFEQRQAALDTSRTYPQTIISDSTSKNTQTYQTLPSNNHKWKL